MRLLQRFSGEENLPLVTVSDDDANGWTVGPAYALMQAAIAGTLAASSLSSQIANTRYDEGAQPIAAPTTQRIEDDGPVRTITLDEQRLRVAVRSWQADDETPKLFCALDADNWIEPIAFDEQRLSVAVRSWQADDETPTLRFALDEDGRLAPTPWSSDVTGSVGPWSQDEDFRTVTVDEEPWKALAPEWPTVTIAAQWSWDDGSELPITQASNIPDEWSWTPPAPTVSPTPAAAWRFDSDESISTVAGAPEELGWIARLAVELPIVGPPAQDEAALPMAPAAAVVDDADGWSPRVPWLENSASPWRVDVDLATATVLEERDWTQPTPLHPAFVRFALWDEGAAPYLVITITLGPRPISISVRGGTGTSITRR